MKLKIFGSNDVVEDSQTMSKALNSQKKEKNQALLGCQKDNSILPFHLETTKVPDDITGCLCIFTTLHAFISKLHYPQFMNSTA